MKRMLSIATLALLFIGCKTDNIIREPSGAYRPWEPAQVNQDYSAVPVRSSTDLEKHIWTGTPVPTVPPTHDAWRPQ